MKRVLIAIDYNPTAQKVAESGYSMAKAMGAEIYLVHVVTYSENYFAKGYPAIMGFDGYIGVDTSHSNLVESVKQSSHDFLDQVKNHLFDKDIHVIVKEGNAAKSILEIAKELSVDMIVMGSHSQKWLAKVIMGSTTENVLNETDTSLLIVPTKMSGKTSTYTPVH